MKIIKITTENEITTLEFPEGDITSVNKRLYEMIGPKCELMEHVMPSRLYKILGAYHEMVDRVNLDHLDLICEALDCSLDELIVRVPNKTPRATRTINGSQKSKTDE